MWRRNRRTEAVSSGGKEDTNLLKDASMWVK